MSAIRPRPQIPRSTGSGTDVARLPKKRHITDEGRQRLSEIATERHRNGGFQKQPGSKPRKPSKKRVAARVAAAAREKKNAQAIIDVFKDGVHPSQPMNIRIKAAEAWIKVEQDDAKLRIRESDSEGQQRDREELLSLLSERLTTGHAAMLLRKQLESESIGFTDGDVIEGKLIQEERIDGRAA
jgi:hypothetical protein